MDTKRVVIGVVLAMAVVLGWDVFVTYLGRKQGWQMQPQQAATTTNATASTEPATAPSTRAAIATGPTSMSAGMHVVEDAVQPRLITLGSATDQDYVMALNLTTRGAAVDSVVLNQFHQTVNDKSPFTFQTPYAGMMAEDYSLAATGVVVNGTTLNLAGRNWKLETQSGPGQMAAYALDVADDSGPLLRIRKTYEVYKRQETRDSSKGYEISVRYSLENLSKNPVSAKLFFNGPTMPPEELDRGGDRQIITAYDDNGRIKLAHHTVEEFNRDKPMLDLTRMDKGQSLVWGGEGSAYFNALVLPAKPEQIAKMQAVTLNPEEQDATKRHIALTFETSEMTVAAGAQDTVQMSVFFGPKKRDLLNTAYYSNFPRAYNQTLVMTGGPCAWCTFSWLIDILVWLLAAFHWVFGGFAGRGDWGLAIIALVLLVRLILHPISKKSQVNMMQMGKLGPEIERLKKKYADDKDEMNKAMMQLYKEQGFTPILGCLPMLLQMPIWIALWSALQSTFELRQAPFLWGFTWIHDLAKPDALIAFSHPIPLYVFGWQLHSINLLPILLGFVFYLQQKYTPKPVAATPEQEQQQKMMQWMSLLFPLMLYTGPSGLNLYIFTSTAIGIWESKIIRKHIKEREEAEKAGKVFVETRATRSGKRMARQEGGEEVKKKGGLMGWLADLQDRAEKMRDQNERKKDK